MKSCNNQYIHVKGIIHSDETTHNYHQPLHLSFFQLTLIIVLDPAGSFFE